MKKLRVLFPEILFIAAVMAALLISMACYNRSLEAPAATEQGVWWVSAEQEPQLIWKWQNEEHMVGQQCAYWDIIDGNDFGRVYIPQMGWASVQPAVQLLRQQSNIDWTLGEKAYLVNSDLYGGEYVTDQEGTTIEVVGLPMPLYARRLSTSYDDATYIPIWPEAERCLWSHNRWLHSVMKLEDDRLCVIATRLTVSRANAGTCHLVSDFFDYQEGDLVLAGTEGLPVVLRPRAEGGFDRWTLIQTYEDNPPGASFAISWIDREANRYAWVKQRPLSIEDYPALAQPYHLDLTRGYRELLYLDDAGRLCVADLKPNAKPTVLDDTLRLTAEDLAQIDRYGNAITLPLSGGMTRVYFPRTNAFGKTKWLHWDLP